MELSVALLLEILRDFKFRVNIVKEHAKKGVVEAFSSKDDQVMKENQRLPKLLEESGEQRSSSD